jgi:hypothetical protein
MRITVEIDESEVLWIQMETGMNEPSLAIAAALRAYLEERRRRKIIQPFLDGRVDYSSQMMIWRGATLMISCEAPHCFGEYQQTASRY